MFASVYIQAEPKKKSGRMHDDNFHVRYAIRVNRSLQLSESSTTYAPNDYEKLIYPDVSKTNTSIPHIS